MHISSSYAKILGERNFHTREIPGSVSKAEDGEKEKRKKEVKTIAKLHGVHKQAWRTQAAWAKIYD